VIADAEGPDDITATVAYAARHGLQVTVQATVHGAGGSMENAILLHTSGLREVTVDPGQQRVRVGSGVRTGDLLTALSPHGLALARVPALFGGQLMWPAAAALEVFDAWASWVPGLTKDTASSACVLQFPPLPELPEALRGGLAIKSGARASSAC
jgi:FAD/FMN-containing dehydrogenase